METKEQQGSTRFVKGAVILAVAGILCKLMGVLFRVWAYDILGEAGMDYYEIVFPFYSWLLIISSSGIPAAISRMVAERTATGDYAGARKVFTKSLGLMAIIGLVTTAVLYFGAGWFTRVLAHKPPDYALSFQALAPALFFVSLLCAYRGYLQGVQRMAGTGISQIAEQLAKCVFALLLARLWLPKGVAYAAAGVLLGVAASELVALLVMMLFTWRNRRVLMPQGANLTAKNDSGILKKMLAIAVPITLGASIIPLTSMIDVSMIHSILGKYMSADEVQRCYVALSSNVRSIINLPAGITVSLAMSLVPAISAARASGDKKGLTEATQLGIKLSMVVGLPCAVGLFVLGGPIIHMLFRSISPESLALATSLMRYASITVVFISLVQTATGALQGIGQQRLSVYFLLIGGVVKVISGYILLRIPAISINGASISNLLCYGVAGILDTIFLLRHVQMKLSLWDVFGKPVLGALWMGVLIWSCYRLLYRLHPGSLATLGAILIGVAVYLLLVFALKMFNESELRRIPGGRKMIRFLGEKKLPHGSEQ